jgi:hypothetical protein
MNFNETNLNFVLSSIEENLSFQGNNLKEAQDWNIKLNLPIKNLIDKKPETHDEIRFIIETLAYLDYIKINYQEGIINEITVRGLKFLYLRLHKIEFI